MRCTNLSTAFQNPKIKGADSCLFVSSSCRRGRLAPCATQANAKYSKLKPPQGVCAGTGSQGAISAAQFHTLVACSLIPPVSCHALLPSHKRQQHKHTQHSHPQSWHSLKDQYTHTQPSGCSTKFATTRTWFLIHTHMCNACLLTTTAQQCR